MHYALDTNILAYAEGVDDPERQIKAQQLLNVLNPSDVVVPVQALGELFNVLMRKFKWPAAEARAAVLAWTDAYEAIETTPGILLDAMELSHSHQLAM